MFVVGAMRSGTTLLRLVLDSHERLALADESGFLRAVAATLDIPDQLDGQSWYRRFGVSDEEMHARLRTFYDDLFSSWARSQGAVRWGDKTPFHTAHLPLIPQVFPDAVIVGIVRHPGAVVASQIRRGKDFSTAVRNWRGQNLRLLRAAQAEATASRLAVLRYEDLVTAPEPVLRELLAFLGEPWSPAVLHHHEVQADRGRLAEGGTRRQDAIDPDRRSRWRDELSGAQQRQLAVATAGLRQVFAYDEDEAAPLGARLLLGPDLAARARSVPRAAFARSLLPAQAAPSRRRGWRRSVEQVLHLGRSDPAYLLRRLPLALRAQLRQLRSSAD